MFHVVLQVSLSHVSCSRCFFLCLNHVSCRTTNRLLPDKNGAVNSIELATSMPPRYVDFKEQIRAEMFSIKQKMSELRKLHGRAALTSFDDSDSNEAQIEVLTQDITRLFKRGEAKLQQFTSGPADSEPDEKVF